MRALRNETLSWPTLRTNACALRRASESMSSFMSTPMTRPAGPTIWLTRNTALPAPEPRSSTVSPSRTCRVGSPHP